MAWGFPKIRGTFLGVPIMRTVVFWGLSWVPLFCETTIYTLNRIPNPLNAKPQTLIHKAENKASAAIVAPHPGISGGPTMSGVRGQRCLARFKGDCIIFTPRSICSMVLNLRNTGRNIWETGDGKWHETSTHSSISQHCNCSHSIPQCRPCMIQNKPFWLRVLSCCARRFSAFLKSVSKKVRGFRREVTRRRCQGKFAVLTTNTSLLKLLRLQNL